MSVELDPPELGFRRPFTQEVTQVLKLTNSNADPVAFKVKTTAPKQYCVRPNSGSIQPGKSVEVQVLLQSMKEDPPLDAKCRDKFLVQSVAIDADQAQGGENVWANLDKIAKDSIKEKKIRVNFLPARGHEDGIGAAATTNGTSGHETAPPAYAPPTTPPSTTASPLPAPQTARDFSTPSKVGNGPESPYAQAGIAAAASGAATSPLSNSTTTEGTTSSAPLVEKAAGLYNSAAQSLANNASSAGETLQQQLDAAKEQILSLKDQIQSQNLRQRAATATGTDTKSTPSSFSTNSRGPVAVQHATGEGVPVQMVAALCLLSFLIAYFFF